MANKQIEEKRTAARRARWFARQLSRPDDQERLSKFADELDGEADALERTDAAEKAKKKKSDPKH